jgi:hypothetical protein
VPLVLEMTFSTDTPHRGSSRAGVLQGADCTMVSQCAATSEGLSWQLQKYWAWKQGLQGHLKDCAPPVCHRVDKWAECCGTKPGDQVWQGHSKCSEPKCTLGGKLLTSPNILTLRPLFSPQTNLRPSLSQIIQELSLPCHSFCQCGPEKSSTDFSLYWIMLLSKCKGFSRANLEGRCSLFQKLRSSKGEGRPK